MITKLNDDVKLYRFISYDKLLDSLVNKRFVFVKCKLYNDPWELFFHKAEFVVNEYDSWGHPQQERFFAMCFTKAKESEALWRIHSKNESGVKIVTSVKRLRGLVKDSELEFKIYLDEMDYNDDIRNENYFINKFPKAKTPEALTLACLFLKREAFKYEQEVRLILDSKNIKPDKDVHFIYVNDPNEIIEEIRLDPRIDTDTETLQQITLKKLGFKGIVAKSKLYSYNNIRYKTNINPFTD